MELAQSEYLLPRLTGQWSHLERLEGRIGTRGPGETQFETDRRLVRTRITRLKREIDEVRQQRELTAAAAARRACRSSRSWATPTRARARCMNALSGADVFAENHLFATLDPLTRRVTCLPATRSC